MFLLHGRFGSSTIKCWLKSFFLCLHIHPGHSMEETDECRPIAWCKLASYKHMLGCQHLVICNSTSLPYVSLIVEYSPPTPPAPQIPCYTLWRLQAIYEQDHSPLAWLRGCSCSKRQVSWVELDLQLPLRVTSLDATQWHAARCNDPVDRLRPCS